MSETEPQSAAPPPPRPWFQFSLQTLLLLFVVLASSLAVFGAGGIVVFLLVVALAVYLNKFYSVPSLTYIILGAVCLICLYSLLLVATVAHEAGPRAQCMNNLKQIELALLNYESANGHFPPAYVADKDGKPMHSWRVLILPYLDQDALYKTYNLNEPWDGPNNKKLLTSRPLVYSCPSDPSALGPGATETTYVAVIGKDAAWSGEKPRMLKDIAGGSSSTIMIVEVADSGVPWTKPEDVSLDALVAANANSSPLIPSSHHGVQSDFFFIYEHCSGANVAFADGRVEYLPPHSLSAEYLPRLLRMGGYNDDEIVAMQHTYDEHRRLNWPNIAALLVWLVSVGTLLTRAVRSRRPPAVAFPLSTN